MAAPPEATIVAEAKRTMPRFSLANVASAEVAAAGHRGCRGRMWRTRPADSNERAIPSRTARSLPPNVASVEAGCQHGCQHHGEHDERLRDQADQARHDHATQ